MNLPSIQTLSAITKSPKTLRKALEAFRDDKETLRATMERADELIGGHGVEYIRHKKDTMRTVYGLDYVNMGDAYTTTLLFDHATESFKVGPWGNIVETAPDGTYS